MRVHNSTRHLASCRGGLFAEAVGLLPQRGSDNRMEPGGPDLGQPTHFRPRRRRGVFAVTVPADFGNKEIVWTLTFRGESNSIPGHLHRDWMLDAIGGEAGGNTPPTLQLEPGGTEGRGPRGVTAGPRTATVGQPVTLDVWVSDDGVTRPRRPLPRRRLLAGEIRHQLIMRGPPRGTDPPPARRSSG